MMVSFAVGVRFMGGDEPVNAVPDVTGAVFAAIDADVDEPGNTVPGVTGAVLDAEDDENEPVNAVPVVTGAVLAAIAEEDDADEPVNDVPVVPGAIDVGGVGDAAFRAPPRPTPGMAHPRYGLSQ